MTIESPATPTLSPSLEEQVRHLYDRSQISDVLYAYASSCDMQDVARLRTLFTPGARARYGKTQEWLEGGSTIAEWIGTATAPTQWQHHLINVYDVAVEGDRATACVYLISHQTTRAEPDTVLMMTSRYAMQLVRDGGSWRIDVLDLLVGWMDSRHASQADLP
jgi:3-phenylpropionate/cinnamic acid dioxygenase small subunit